ncbi:hypothetical protein MM221_10720 [Salipaludibacillus sp. LMS25]|uniref:hypothetical protein n=1 Tax=Salipaludibacillus sp. LMS25 TaxID=2924031 RepID=UPI0020D0034B|nr:hypothetical protein [Salipaludibacillus sp. LMS25]UTR13131.1 hypothetical protein MM221_10720 [Salipaludibacillus sp. LMS25]
MCKNKIYILLTDTGTLFTRMIKLYTKAPYNHASVAFDHHLIEVYSFGRKTPRNPFIGGFVKENLRAHYFKQARCAIYSCDVTTEQLERMQQFIHKIDRQKHLYSYNLLGLFAITIKKRFIRKNAFFCSQFVATLLQECGIVNYTKEPFFMTPQDLIKSEKFQLVYQGDLENYYKHQDMIVENERQLVM